MLILTTPLYHLKLQMKLFTINKVHNYRKVIILPLRKITKEIILSLSLQMTSVKGAISEQSELDKKTSALSSIMYSHRSVLASSASYAVTNNAFNGCSRSFYSKTSHRSLHFTCKDATVINCEMKYFRGILDIRSTF